MTDRTLDELAQLERTHGELRAALDAIPLATLIRDRDGRVLYSNDPGGAGYGLSGAELIGRLEQDILPEGNDLQGALEVYRYVADSGVATSGPDTVFKTHDGRTLRLYVSYKPLRFQGQPAVLVNAFDTTDLREGALQRARLERRMAETQRLEGLGLMAGGIAHDFNNLLVGVFVNAELAQRQLEPDSVAAVHIEQLRLAANRLADLSRQMLSYSGRAHVEAEPTDVSELASELVKLLRASVPAHVELETCLPGGLPRVRADRAQLGQVVMNLVTNAAEAMGEQGGRVRVSTGTEYHDSASRADLTVRARREPGEYVFIEVRDDGPGMDCTTRDRIFDPFFTTKASGRGLGLASVLGIARAHDAALHVETRQGEGSCFRLWLPPTQQPTPSPAVAVGAAPQDTQPHVLVVDDQTMVREATAAALAAVGFVVSMAADGDAALAQARRELPDAVVLDMSMPGRSGRNVHAALRKIAPQLPILLMSGYSDPSLLKELLAMPATAFIEKPFSGDDLATKLRALLG